MLKRILLGIGGTPFTYVAIQHATELAALHGARLTAITVVNPNEICKLGPVPPGAGIYAKRLCQNRMDVTVHHIEEAISEFEKTCGQMGIAHEVLWESGDPFETMISCSRYHDLMIFGLGSLFEYKLAEHPEKDLLKLLSHGVRPILTVARQFRPINQVMVAYNGSMESAHAMRRFVQSRLWPDASLEIVHYKEGTDGNNALLMDAAAYCQDHGYTVNTRMMPGQAGEQMLSTAREINADMIVMGNSLRGIWLRKMLGDTVLNTLAQTDRPLYLSQ